MRTFLTSVAVLTAVASTCIATALAAPATAQGLSPGCEFFENRVGEVYTGSGPLTALAFAAGEHLTAMAGPPTREGSPTAVTLSIDNDTVDTAPFPGTVEYVFPAAAVVRPFWTVDVGLATWTITCNAAPQTPPVAANDEATTPKNTPITIDVLANDTDADDDQLSVTNLTAPSNGTVALNTDGTVTYTPQTGFVGVDTFTYTAHDGTADSNVASVTVEVINRPPDCSAANPSVAVLWPPNHQFVAVNVLGVTDPDGDPLTFSIDSIRQDEPTGHNAPDGRRVGATAAVRSERLGSGDGRVYHISFNAADADGGVCSGTVTVVVPHDQGNRAMAVDGGPLHDSMT